MKTKRVLKKHVERRCIDGYRNGKPHYRIYRVKRVGRGRGKYVRSINDRKRLRKVRVLRFNYTVDAVKLQEREIKRIGDKILGELGL